MIKDYSILSHILTHETKDNVKKIGKALSSKERLDILLLLSKKSLGKVEIANRLNIQVSSTAFHLKILEEANLINIKSVTGNRGVKKLCSLQTKKIDLEFVRPTTDRTFTSFSFNIPIGSYIDFNAVATPTCGLASEKEIIEIADNPSSFYSPNKTEAQIIWFGHGYLAYKCPNYFIVDHEVQEITFSCEICSEAPYYNLNFKSDITIWINDIEIFTYISPSDYGDRPGKYTPDWWRNNLTQYGDLKKFSVTKNGGYINGKLVNPDISIDSLNLTQNPFISFKIGNKDDAINKGGLNIFGSKFGDYKQDIIMEIKCK